MVGGGWGLRSHFIAKPNLVLWLGWGFDNWKPEYQEKTEYPNKICHIRFYMNGKSEKPGSLFKKRIIDCRDLDLVLFVYNPV